MKTIREKIGKAISIFLVCMIIIAIIFPIHNIIDFKKNKMFGIGEVVECSSNRAIIFIYFNYKGKRLRTISNNTMILQKFYLFENKKFPVIYSKNSNNGSKEILIFKEDFEKYGLAYPDSLMWVYK